jgi:hypothetical protein
VARPDPSLEKDRSEIDDPRCTKSRMLSALPIRPNDRKLNELPRFTKSSTLNVDPKRATPKIAIALATWPKDRRLKELPR